MRSNGIKVANDCPVDPPSVPDPCEELKLQKQNAVFQAKVADLQTKTSLQKESGFEEKKSGGYTTLTNSTTTDNTQNLIIDITSNSKGFNHTHLDDYPSTELDGYGNPKIWKPIRMFSPADVNTLMQLAQLNSSSGDFSQYFVNMVSSDGNYSIKFNGSTTDIKTGFSTNAWQDAYKEFYKVENGSDEKIFLKFLKENMEVNGVELYKIHNNGITEKKSLTTNANGKLRVTNTPCPQ